MVSRRNYLRACSAGALASLVGCTALPLDDSGDDAVVVESRNVHPNARFGSAVALDGDLLAVGAPRALNRAGEFGGTGFVYERDDGWGKQARLRPASEDLSSPNADEARLSFGTHVATADGTVVVGSALSPVASVYERSGHGWQRDARLKPATTEAVERGTHPNVPEKVSCYGTSLDFDGETVALATNCSVEDPEATVETVHVFERGDHEWREAAAVQRDDPREWDRFGYAIAVEDGTLAIAGTEGGGDDPQHRQVVVRVYERGEDGWAEQTAFRPDAMHRYGGRTPNAIALSGDALAVSDNERVAVFERTDGEWVRTASLRPDGIADDRNLDWSLALAGETLVAGAPGATVDTDVHGSAFVYERSGGEWALERRLSQAAAVADGGFGSGVAVDEDAVAVGGGIRREDRADQQTVFVFPL